MAVSNMRATLLYPIEVVWDTVTNLNDFSWRSDLKDVRIIDENNFIEITKNGVETYFRITECIKYQSWIFEIENKNIKGTWVGKFYVEDDKTILDFTENVVKYEKKNSAWNQTITSKALLFSMILTAMSGQIVKKLVLFRAH
ncbi:MAG: polyketide cyclase [Veillonella sp.]|nr:polyketide cyclase [Veillonella sp.]